jgi:hypothetical protein
VTVDVDAWTCEFCDRTFKTQKGAILHERDWCPENPNANRPTVGRPKVEPPPEAGDEPTAETAPVEPGVFDEAPPAEPAKAGWREKIWGSGSAKPATLQTTERRPRKRRRSTEGIWQLVWTGAGRALIYTSADIPVGNAMTFQGPVVGPILDKAIAGTFIDTLLQPLAGAGERFEDVSDVVSLPALVGIMERAPQMAPALEPLLRKAIRRHLVEYARMAKAQKKEDEQYRKALDDLGMSDVGDDPVDGIMAQIWAAPPEAAGGSNGQASGVNVEL